MEDNFSMGHGFVAGGGERQFGDDSSALCLLAIYFYFYIISSTSDHQALDPRGWDPWIKFPSYFSPVTCSCPSQLSESSMNLKS